MPTAISKTFKTTILRDGSMCCVPVTFDPKVVFGKTRAPVKVTINGYTFASTITTMGGSPWVPLRKSNREAARLDGGETISVTLTLDAAKRDVKPQPDLVKALKAAPPAWDRCAAMSYTHKPEWVEAIADAKKPETRARRIASAVEKVRAMAPQKTR